MRGKATRLELARRVARRLSLPVYGPDGTYLLVRAVVDEMAESLGRGERLELRGFGSFRPTLRPSRRQIMPSIPPGSTRVPQRVGFVFRPSVIVREAAREALRVIR